MKKIRITVKKIVQYDDLIEEYENPIEHACSMKLGKWAKDFIDGKYGYKV